MTHGGGGGRALAQDSSRGSASPITGSFYIQSISPAPRKYHIYLQKRLGRGSVSPGRRGQLVMGAGPGRVVRGAKGCP